MTDRPGSGSPWWLPRIDSPLTWLAIVIFLGLGIGLRYPWPADEPRFALIGLEMIHSGDWLFPHRGGELYPDKPPVFMWLQALSFLLIGKLRWSFLLPSLLASLASLWLVWDLSRRLYGEAAGRASLLLLLFTVQFVAQAKSAQIDATLCGFTTLALYGLGRHFLLGPSRGWHAIAWLAMGTGIITKGVGFLPVFFLPGFAIVQLLRRRRGLSTFEVSSLDYATAILILLPIAAWLVPMLWVVASSHDPALTAYRDEILLRQTATRYAAGLGHTEPASYYLLNVIPGMWLPVSVLLLWLVPAWYRQLRALDRATWALGGYVLLALLFFTISPGKRGVYLLPLLPAVAVLAAPHLAQVCARRAVRGAAAVVLAILASILVVAGILALAGFEPVLEQLSELELSPVLAASIVILTGIGVALCILLRDCARSWIAASVLIWAVTTCVVYPMIDPVRSGESLMRTVDRRIGPDAELAIVDYREQLLLQARREVVHWSYHGDRAVHTQQAARWLTRGPDRWLLIPEYVAIYCFIADPDKSVGYRHSRNWLLLQRDAIDPSRNCLAGQDSLPMFVSPKLMLD
ncbi:MAG TPA: glycosyltransferase family 39 protein [Chromatiales bacterium]|nr:glycosyltransferase family 39 protein [Chromatiales bacterium]